jgi:hypothetical protein
LYCALCSSSVCSADRHLPRLLRAGGSAAVRLHAAGGPVSLQLIPRWIPGSSGILCFHWSAEATRAMEEWRTAEVARILSDC